MEVFRKAASGISAAGLSCLVLVSAALIFSSPKSVPGPAAPSSQDPIDLPEILEKCAVYCDRLEGVILDFVCTESIVETTTELAGVKPTPVQGSRYGAMFNSRWARPGKTERSRFVYDYQLIRGKTGAVTERRTLLLENGRKVEEKDAALKTKAFTYSQVVMGPLGLLSRDEQSRLDFEFVKEATFKKEKAIIVEATPKPGNLGEFLYGKIWIRKNDAAILRIEWEPESMGNYEGIELLAKALGLEPQLIFTSEYAFEKNGIRFPSRYKIEERYLRRLKTALIRSTTDVTFSDYKFFTVETGVEIR